MGALSFGKTQHEDTKARTDVSGTASGVMPLRGKAARPVLLRPHLTEKAARLAQEQRVYVFIVDRNATKTAVKHAVEKRWRVNVARVGMMRTPRVKKARGGRVLRVRPSFKKAIVTLKEGQKIELAP